MAILIVRLMESHWDEKMELHWDLLDRAVDGLELELDEGTEQS